MKQLVLLLFTLFFFCPSVYATEISILSETHQVRGLAGGTGAGETAGSYDIIANHPVSGAASGYYFDCPDMLELSQSTAQAGNFEIALVAGRWEADAFGTSTYTFMSDSSRLELSTTGYAEQTHGMDMVSIFLLDLTLGNDILSYSFQPYQSADNGGGPVMDFSWSKSLSLDITHIYQLAMYAEATTGGSLAFSGLKASFAPRPVPEPSTVLFLAFGIAGLLGRFRSQGNRWGAKENG